MKVRCPQTVFSYLVIIIVIFCIAEVAIAQEKVPIEQPVTVNGDTVEYSTEKKEVTASGNVNVEYKGTVLHCNKLTVNTLTKDAVAEGDVHIADENGMMRGEKIIYNFNNKKGTVIRAVFSSEPYFGKSQEIQRIDDKKFVSLNGYVTTCDFDRPHYNLRSRKVIINPKDKIQTRKNTLVFGSTPVMFLPFYNHSLKDPLMHVQLTPGYSKRWGAYLLSAWRSNFMDNVNARIYLDYRSKLGLGSGLGTNFQSDQFGRGDFKFYYTHENDENLDRNQPHEFQRYFVRMRHKWDFDERTNLTSEYYRIEDSRRMILGTEYNVLKDYFPREYEKDTQPLSYSFLHHTFTNSGLDILVQKRTNRWYTQTEKLPEVKYTLPSFKIGDLPLYFEDIIQGANLNQKNAVPSESRDDTSVNRFDAFNKIYLPAKVSFIELTPFVASRQTYYDNDTNESSISPRTVFYTGAEASTKFYRIFDTQPGFMGMDITGLRHIITPKLGYSYNHEPTISSARLKQFDAIDAIGRSNAVNLELSNKFQTKRNANSVDFFDFRVTTDYIFYRNDPMTAEKTKSSFSDFLFYLNFLPYSWARIDADADYEPHRDYFTNANYNINLSLTKNYSVGLGQRYQRSGANELTFNTDWRISPKWKFRVYERYQFKKTTDVRDGMVMQEYTFSRDLHCWLFDIAYTIEKEHGHSIWCIFRLKAFPEAEVHFTTSFSSPQSGSQSY